MEQNPNASKNGGGAFERGIITIREGKTGKNQRVRMNGTVRTVSESLAAPADRAGFVLTQYPDPPTGYITLNRD